MKHSFKKAVALLLLSALLLPNLIGCGTNAFTFTFSSAESRALKLLKIDVNDLENVDSYVLTVETAMRGKDADGAWTRNDKEVHTMTGLHDADKLDCYTKSESTRWQEEGDSTVTTILESGFTGGKMFSRQSVTDGDSVSLTSPLTGKEYLAHLKSLNSTLLADILKEEAATITCEKNDAGEWEAHFSGFSGTGLERVLIYFDVTSAMFKNKIENAELVFRANKKFQPLEMRFEVTFEEAKGSKSELSYVGTYSDYNNAAATALDLTDFKEVVDLRLAAEAAALFRQIECATSLSFSKVEKYYLRPDTESGRKEMFESYYYDVTQTSGEEGYAFNADITVNGKKTRYDYADGQLSLEVNGKQDPPKKMTDSTARSRVYGWFDTTFFNHCNLTTSESVLLGNRFKFKSVDLEALEPKIVAVGSGMDQIRRTSSSLDVVIEDGVLLSYSYMASVWIYLRGNPYVVYYEVTVDNIAYSLAG